MTLHWTGRQEADPGPGDVLERVNPDGSPTRALPMLVVGSRLITRGTCAWACFPSCRRYRLAFVRIAPDTVPDDARIIPTFRGPHPDPRV